MFTVYKITNKINNKCYIGSSIRTQKRWKEHINASNNPNSPHYNYPLYCAFRKYGIDNFSFKVIKDDFNSVKEMTDYEREMIIFFDSYENGYNQTLQTDRINNATENLNKYNKKISQKCAKVDKFENILEIYDSYHDAARKNDLNGEYEATAIRDVCKGNRSSTRGLYFRDLDGNNNVVHKEMKRYYGKKSLVCIPVEEEKDTLYFESVSQAAKQLSTDRQSIGKCIAGSKRYSIVHGYIIREIDIYGNIIENEISIDEKIKEYNKKHPIINGIRHNIPEWCKIYNMNPSTVNTRIRKGVDPIEAITTPVRR